MQILTLRADQTENLLGQPESGMGFQIVEAEKSHSLGSEAWLVFNSELAIALSDTTEDQSWLQSRSYISERSLRGEAKAVGSLFMSFKVATTRSGIGRPPSRHGLVGKLAPAAHSLVKES